jgi:multiple antibiotic resistance protein
MLTPSEKQFALLAFSSLFSVINPISAAPIFVAMTAAAAVMAVFAAAGGAIFAFFGITVPAFQIAGGVIFAAISVRTLQNGEKEAYVGESADPSIVPLGIPVIAGPGAITTVMVLVGQALSGTRTGVLPLPPATDYPGPN